MPATSIRQHSAAAPLALAYAALVLYASLYPFAGWRWPPGVSLGALLHLPWPPWRDNFDVLANLLGYLPLGGLLYLAWARRGVRWWRSALYALVAASGLSYVMECMQQFVPARVPSLVDWALNSAGAAAGVGLAALLQASGGLDRWQSVRERWLLRDGAWGLALLALWPVGLLFPAPLPLALGHFPGGLINGLADLAAEWPWAQTLQRFGSSRAPLPASAEAAVQMLGLLAPCLLAFCIMRPGWRRWLMSAAVLLLALCTTTLSTALSVGPEHALAWVTPMTVPAWALGALLAALAWRVNVRTAALLALTVLAALVVLVDRAPADPYFMANLQSWEQGRFVRFHGAALWIGRLWPYAAMLWLTLRLRRPN